MIVRDSVVTLIHVRCYCRGEDTFEGLSCELDAALEFVDAGKVGLHVAGVI